MSEFRPALLATLIAGSLLLPLSGCTSLAKLGVGPNVADPGARTTSVRLNDISLGQAIRRDIYRDIPAARDARIDVTVFYKAALLTGEVQDQSLKDKVAEIARSYPDVQVVHNELSIGPTRSFVERSGDNLLESKANLSLGTADGVHSGQTNVIAVGGTLYLMGKLTQRETDRAIVRLQALDGVRRIVKIVDILPDPGPEAR